MLVLNEVQIPTLNANEVLALTKLKSSVSECFSLDRIILFGSKARGDYDKDSDVDLLVIVGENNNFENKGKLSDIVFNINLEYDTLFTCILKNKQKWTNGVGEYTSFIEDVRNEGIEIELK